MQGGVGVMVQYWLANAEQMPGSDLAKRKTGCGEMNPLTEIALCLEYLCSEGEGTSLKLPSSVALAA